MVLAQTSLFDRYLSWRRKTFPASKEDVSSRYEAILARIENIEKVLASCIGGAEVQPETRLRLLDSKQSNKDSSVEPIYKRFLSDNPNKTSDFLQSAKDYVGNLPESGYAYLYEKPFDRLAGPPTSTSQLHIGFYQELYQVVNLLHAMEVPFGGRVLEVGSGPGWVSEILLGLGYSVDGIDPSGDMIRIANERVEAFIKHHRIGDPPQFEFHCCTLEDCQLPEASFDAVFFHAALHHVIDENEGLRQCLRLLKPGGVLGVNESCWHPGNLEMEAILNEEMEKYGTLENPFTIEYLDHLLNKHGFVDIERYHGVNGLFPVRMGRMMLQDIAQSPASASNILTARKPALDHWRGLTTADKNGRSRCVIEILNVDFTEATSTVSVELRIKNCGDTAWLNKLGVPGSVSVALYQGNIGTSEFNEAIPRHGLPVKLLPDEEWIGSFVYRLPTQTVLGDWKFDLVSEYMFWFSERGNDNVPLKL
jgi:SAM-dependent methyltransferase